MADCNITQNPPPTQLLWVRFKQSKKNTPSVIIFQSSQKARPSNPKSTIHVKNKQNVQTPPGKTLIVWTPKRLQSNCLIVGFNISKHASIWPFHECFLSSLSHLERDRRVCVCVCLSPCWVTKTQLCMWQWWLLSLCTSVLLCCFYINERWRSFFITPPPKARSHLIMEVECEQASLLWHHLLPVAAVWLPLVQEFTTNMSKDKISLWEFSRTLWFHPVIILYIINQFHTLNIQP